MGSSDPSEEMIGRELIGIHSDSDYADARLRFGGVLKDTRDEIRRRIDSWHNSMPAKGDAPYDRERMLLESEERDLAAGKASLGAVLEDIDLASDFRSDPYLGILWGRANAHRDDRGALLNIRRETLSRWRSMYDAGSAAEYRGATDDDAASAAESVRASVRKSTEAIALGGRAGRADFGEAYMTDARGSGRSPLRPSDLSRAAAMAGGISSDPEILALCRSLGKRIAPEEGRGIQSVPSAAGSDDLLSHEEITGTGIGRSISDMVPSELLYLGDAVLERIFDLDYAERMMLVFAREGSVQEGLSESSRSMKEPGPAIICVDTSGSMRGKKEDAAKAAALAICSEMLSENRACYLIDFSAVEELWRRHRPVRGLQKGLGGHGLRDLRTRGRPDDLRFRYAPGRPLPRRACRSGDRRRSTPARTDSRAREDRVRSRAGACPRFRDIRLGPLHPLFGGRGISALEAGRPPRCTWPT